MIYLLDTNVVLWAASGSPRLSPASQRVLSDGSNGFMFSSAVIWEVAIKSTLGRADFEADARLLRRGLLENGASELPITSDHAIAAAELPPLHKDPFDRIQIAQARTEGLVLLTGDPQVADYGDLIELV